MAKAISSSGTFSLRILSYSFRVPINGFLRSSNYEAGRFVVNEIAEQKARRFSYPKVKLLESLRVYSRCLLREVSWQSKVRESRRVRIWTPDPFDVAQSRGGRKSNRD